VRDSRAAIRAYLLGGRFFFVGQSERIISSWLLKTNEENEMETGTQIE
jgi:hypothetical protein